MATIKVDAISLAGQPKTLFASMKNDINLNVNGTTTLKVKLTDKGNHKYEIEIVA